jgi:hypothetical protein
MPHNTDEFSVYPILQVVGTPGFQSYDMGSKDATIFHRLKAWFISKIQGDFI